MQAIQKIPMFFICASYTSMSIQTKHTPLKLKNVKDTSFFFHEMIQLFIGMYLKVDRDRKTLDIYDV